jgi:predicted phosphodiesterase
MRTLKLTHKQIEIISHALGISERQMLNIHQDINKNVVYVNGNVDTTEQLKDSNRYLSKSFEFYDLLQDIKKSTLDV